MGFNDGLIDMSHDLNIEVYGLLRIRLKSLPYDASFLSMWVYTHQLDIVSTTLQQAFA